MGQLLLRMKMFRNVINRVEREAEELKTEPIGRRIKYVRDFVVIIVISWFWYHRFLRG